MAELRVAVVPATAVGAATARVYKTASRCEMVSGVSAVVRDLHMKACSCTSCRAGQVNAALLAVGGDTASCWSKLLMTGVKMHSSLLDTDLAQALWCTSDLCRMGTRHVFVKVVHTLQWYC